MRISDWSSDVCSSDLDMTENRPLGNTEAALLSKEAEYCSFGDTVHYQNPPKIFDRCEGSFLYDAAGTPYLDLQMWYSAVNFGYANKRLNDALKSQIDRLPQLASDRKSTRLNSSH